MADLPSPLQHHANKIGITWEKISHLVYMPLGCSTIFHTAGSVQTQGLHCSVISSISDICNRKTFNHMVFVIHAEWIDCTVWFNSQTVLKNSSRLLSHLLHQDEKSKKRHEPGVHAAKEETNQKRKRVQIRRKEDTN